MTFDVWYQYVSPIYFWTASVVFAVAGIVALKRLGGLAGHVLCWSAAANLLFATLEVVNLYLQKDPFDLGFFEDEVMRNLYWSGYCLFAGGEAVGVLLVVLRIGKIATRNRELEQLVSARSSPPTPPPCS